MTVSTETTPESLRTEYSVIGSYVTAMTGMRFQTVAIYLAALGLIVGREGTPSWPTLSLILAVSVGLWILDLRNREILARHGERGKKIEEKYWKYPGGPEAGCFGFFLDRDKRASLKLATFEIPTTSKWFPRRLISHAFGIDVVFLAVIAYAVVLLALPGY